MSNVLIVVNLVISKEIVRLGDLKLKYKTNKQTNRNWYIKDIKQVLVAMNHKTFQGIVATVERANTDLRIVSPRERSMR